MAAVEGNTGMVFWMFRAGLNETNGAANWVNFSISGGQFNACGNVEWLYIRIPRGRGPGGAVPRSLGGGYLCRGEACLECVDVAEEGLGCWRKEKGGRPPLMA